MDDQQNWAIMFCLNELLSMKVYCYTARNTHNWQEDYARFFPQN